MKSNIKLCSVLLLLISQQLFGFTFNASKTDETCSGNGSISFIVNGLDTNTNLTFIVYKLPDVSNIYASTSNFVLNGLTAGEYRIIAQASVGSSSISKQIDVSISNLIIPLDYNINITNLACSPTSSISIQTVSGNATSFEIIEGPDVFPAQSLNEFSNLSLGEYKIRVFDSCGVGVVKTFTIILNTTGLNVTNPTFSDSTCTNLNVNQIITPFSGTEIAYPLTLKYVVNPPSGISFVINDTITSGNLLSQPISIEMPEFVNESYTYKLTITDNCNSTFNKNFTVKNQIKLSINNNNNNCIESFFIVNISNFTPPYTLNFTNYPDSFDATLYNTQYPGPFYLETTEFKNESNFLPPGEYTLSVEDSCGKTKTSSIFIDYSSSESIISVLNNNCLGNNGVIISNVSSPQINTVIIISAPASYAFATPHNVTSSINSYNTLYLSNLPEGDYLIKIGYGCGNDTKEENVTIPPYENKGLKHTIRNGCEINTSAVRVWSSNGKLVSAKIINSPTSYTSNLPHNISNHIINTGHLFINGLPPGEYEIEALDTCNFTNTITFTITGYTILSNTFSLDSNCGTFNIPLSYESNGTVGETFWLQKLVDPTNQIWGNPKTNTVYNEGTTPNLTNSIKLTNDAVNYNLSFNGTFRIVRNFLSFNNGEDYNTNNVSTVNKNCLEILNPTLSFYEAIEIIDANRMPCSVNGAPDVIINAVGLDPLKYRITNKNGNPFYLDNGNSSIFYNLPLGVYTFQVEDICGNIVNRMFDISNLQSLAKTIKPNDILQCKNQISGNETFDLSNQNSIILGNKTASNFTLSYHINLNDAQNGTNAISNVTNYNPISNPSTVYVRLVFNQLPNCYEITTFDLIVGQIPKINLLSNYLSCYNPTITLDASIGNLPTTTYLWSNGSTSPTITISDIGETNLNLQVFNLYLTQQQSCSTSLDIKIILSEKPEISDIEINDWDSNDENSIIINTTNYDSFEYSIDGNTYQDSNNFSKLSSGLYTVYIRDKNGCGEDSKEIWLLNYPKFFTPNGDGNNQYWRIKNSSNEKPFHVVIYDRYGKTITSFDSMSSGWDGTFNGKELVSDDYWFVVNRKDGRIHKGHFTLKR